MILLLFTIFVIGFCCGLWIQGSFITPMTEEKRRYYRWEQIKNALSRKFEEVGYGTNQFWEILCELYEKDRLLWIKRGEK